MVMMKATACGATRRMECHKLIDMIDMLSRLFSTET